MEIRASTPTVVESGVVFVHHERLLIQFEVCAEWGPERSARCSGLSTPLCIVSGRNSAVLGHSSRPGGPERVCKIDIFGCVEEVN